MGLLDGFNQQLATAMQNPMFNLGVGILGGSQGTYGAFGPQMGQGLALGMQQYRRNREVDSINRWRQQQIEAYQRRALAEQAAARSLQANRQAYENFKGAVTADEGPNMPPAMAYGNLQQAVVENSPDPAAAMLELMQPKAAEKLIPVGKQIYDPNSGQWITPPGGVVDPTSPADLFKMEKDLRSGFDKSAGAFRALSDAYTSIQSIPDTSIGDVALATKMMKLLDPGSVVRESELGVALNSTGLVQRMLNLADKAKQGKLLNPTQRAEFRQLATNLYAAAQSEFGKVKDRYTAMAIRYKLDPRNIVFDYSSSVTEPPAPAPAPSAVEPIEPKTAVGLPKQVRAPEGYPIQLFNFQKFQGIPIAQGNDGKWYEFVGGKWSVIE